MRSAMVIVALALGGCAWFDDGEPGRACKTNRDCFAAQGEVCTAAGVCETVDASSVAPLEVPQ